MNQPELHPPPGGDTGGTTGGAAGGDPMVVDCDRCVVRGPSACGDCVVSVLLGGPPDGVSLDPEEARALDALASVGLVPPLRLVTAVDPGVDPGSATA